MRAKTCVQMDQEQTHDKDDVLLKGISTSGSHKKLKWCCNKKNERCTYERARIELKLLICTQFAITLDSS